MCLRGYLFVSNPLRVVSLIRSVYIDGPYLNIEDKCPRVWHSAPFCFTLYPQLTPMLPVTCTTGMNNRSGAVCSVHEKTQHLNSVCLHLPELILFATVSHHLLHPSVKDLQFGALCRHDVDTGKVVVLPQPLVGRRGYNDRSPMF